MFYDKYSVVEHQCKDGGKPLARWVNMYGAQTGLSNTENFFKDVQNVATFDWKEFYNKFNEHAPSFRGRVLISQRV